MKRNLKILLIFILPTTSNATDLIFQFKDPAFNGMGWSAQVITINQQEQNSKLNIENKKQAQINQAKTDAANTPLAKFMSLFSSQVYAQLATQLSNNLFQNNCKDSAGNPISGCSNTTSGNFSLDGNTVTWLKTAGNVQLTVVDTAGQKTVVTVPIAQFTF